MPRDVYYRGFLRGPYAKGLSRVKYVVIVCWIVVAAGLGVFSLEFTNSTQQDFTAPHGTQAYDANAVLQSYFPGIADDNPYMVYVITTNPSANATLDYDRVPFAFIQNVTARLQTLCLQYIANGCAVYTAESFVNAPAFQLEFETSRGLLSVLSTNLSETSDDSLHLGRTIRSVVDDAKAATIPATPKYADLRVGVVGSTLLIRDVTEDIDKDLALTSAMVLIVAVAMMGFAIRSARLLLLPLFAVLVTFFTSFGMMYSVAQSVSVSAVVPGVMLSLCLAMTVDYSLFIIARYRKEVRLVQHAAPDVVADVLHVVGYSVLTSGLAFSIACWSLIFFPVDLIRGFGFGCGITIMVSTFVNVTFVPAMLMAFPNFFGQGAGKIRCLCYRGSGISEALADGDFYGGVAERDALGTNAEHKVDVQRSTFRHVGKLMHKPINIGVAACIVLVAFILGWQGSEIHTTATYDGYFDRDSDIAHNWADLKTAFAPGSLVPYHLLFSASLDACTSSKSGDVAATLEFASIVDLFLSEMVKTSGLPNIHMKQFLWPSVTAFNNNTILEWFKYFSVHNGSACIAAKFFPDFDPMGPDGEEYYTRLQSYLDNVGTFAAALGCGEVKAYVTGQAPNALDQMRRVYALAPMVIGVTFLVVFILVAVGFRSPVTSLRCLCGVCITLCVTLGLAKAVYQSPGILSWLTWANLRDDHQGIGWLAPLNVFVISAAMSIDCHVYFTSVITDIQFNQDAAATLPLVPLDSILLGLCTSGKIMTSAGLVMATAYLGLLLTNTPLLNEMGFMLVVSVLVDVLLVRGIFMPCLMGLLEGYNWWPQQISEGRVPGLQSETTTQHSSQVRGGAVDLTPEISQQSRTPRQEERTLLSEQEPTLYDPPSGEGAKHSSPRWAAA